MAVDQSMIDQACTSLEVTEVRPLKDGGQKTVRLVEDADGNGLPATERGKTRTMTPRTQPRSEAHGAAAEGTTT